MQNVFLLSILITLISFTVGNSQTTQDTVIIAVNENNDRAIELKGLLLDMDMQTPLPYANIYVLHKNRGAISNEKGHFSINIAGLDETDTLRFQYIGYKTKTVTISDLDSSSVVYLKENIINLSEILVFGSNPDPKSIVKKVLENKDSNYKKTTSKDEVFLREREIADIEKFKLNYKKSTISELDREMIALIEERTPGYVTSYTDCLVYLYFNKNQDDSVTLKINPTRAVSLKEEYIADLEQLGLLFESILANTGEDEYWKVKSGIFGHKLDLDEDFDESTKDSLTDYKTNMSYFNSRVKYHLRYSTLDDDDEWEFLHKTSKYKYTLAGGTRVNGEDVYIIDFVPDKSGLYIGRMYISINAFALIRADYEYTPGKTGTDFHLLGVGYTENQFSGSIYFERKADNYVLKYFSRRTGFNATVDRNLALLKKRKRFLFDKKLNEIKVGLELSVKVEESIEYLVLNRQAISDKQFADFEQMKKMEIIYVDQFDDNLWKGYSIIEPTEQMREYKKQEVNFTE